MTHPTDALPLPEPFAALSDDETPALYKRWADQIRAAHRDGYELAMGKLANQTCVHSRSGGMMQKELIANLTDWASDANAHGNQMVPIHRDTLRRIAVSLVAPIHAPAVTTPREVLVGESPVDRIAAKAMSKTSELLSDMDRSVLRMPRDLAMNGEIAQAQFYDRTQSLLDRIDALAAPAQEQAGAASASLLADALRKLLARTSGEHYPVEQELARTALSSHDDAFRQECDDADELLRMLGLGPDSCRTDGGFINMPRVRSLLIDRNPHGVLSELLECFDLPYPPETAGRDAQSAWGDRRAAAKEQARAVLALKSAGVAEVSDEQIVTALESAGVEFQRFMGGLSGAQDIWTTAGSQQAARRRGGVMLNLKDPAKRAEWVYGQPMVPCPKCGSYNMKPQIPIALETTGNETTPQLIGKWVQATKGGATPLQGPAYYVCWDCHHKGPAVDCTGRTSEDCRADRALNAEMKRLWNTQVCDVDGKPQGEGVA